MIIYVQESVVTKCYINAEDEAKIRAYAKENDISLVNATFELTSEGAVDIWADNKIYDNEIEDIWVDEEE